MPHHIISKTLLGQMSQASVVGSRARTITILSGSHGQSLGNTPASRQSELSKGLDNSIGLFRTIALNAILLEPRLDAIDAEASTVSSTNPISSSKRPSALLPPSYTTSVWLPSLTSANPYLSCIKWIDWSLGNECPRVSHIACNHCIKAKRKCELISILSCPSFLYRCP
jgi:hypothetical protein